MAYTTAQLSSAILTVDGRDATGSRTLTGASAKFKWAGGTAPTLSTGASKRDVFRFRYHAANDAYYEVSRSMSLG